MMYLFHLTSANGNSKEIISTCIEDAIKASGWTVDEVVGIDMAPIKAWPIASHTADGVLKAESWCGAW